MVLDVDSTLIQQEVIELLAERAGVRSQVEWITEQAMSGQLDFSQSLRERVALLAGLEDAVFTEVLSEIQVTDGARELIAFTHEKGGKVGAVSGGFSQVLRSLAEELSLDFYRANKLEIIADKLSGQVVGEIVDAQTKAECLLEWSKQMGIPIANTIAIGDGANDIAMLQNSGLAVAFRPKAILREYADLVIEENSLIGVIAAIEERLSSG